MDQGRFVCLQTGREGPHVGRHRVEGALIVQARYRQAGKTTSHPVQTGIKIHQGLARDDAAEDLPGLGQRLLRSCIQRLEAIPEIFEHLLSSIGIPHQFGAVRAVHVEVSTKLFPVLRRLLDAGLRRIGQRMRFQFAAGAGEYLVAVGILAGQTPAYGCLVVFDCGDQ